MKKRIAHVTVVGDTGGPKYRQQLVSGTHTLTADEPPANGGADARPAPFGYLLAGLGACTSITLWMYAQRKNWNLGTVTVKLDLVRDNDVSHIERNVSVSEPLSEEQRARLADICERTPVTLTLKSGIPIRTELAPNR